MILYADILFIIDLSMDVLALWVAEHLTQSRMRATRVIAAGCVSSALSVAATAMGAGRALSVALTITLPLIMCVIAFGKASPHLFFRRYVFTWLGGLLLGGALTALLRHGAARAYSDALDFRSSVSAAIPVGALSVILFIKTLSRSPPTRHTDVTLTLHRRTVVLRALCDSGNLVTDPFTGECVIVADAEAVRDLFTEDEFHALTSHEKYVPSSLEGRFRVIPACGVSGDTLLRAVRIDEVKVGGKSSRALVALSSTVADAEHAAVIPTRLLG